MMTGPTVCGSRWSKPTPPNEIKGEVLETIGGIVFIIAARALSLSRSTGVATWGSA
jgi:hypothetical protein